MFMLISFHFGLTTHAGGLVGRRMPRLVNRAVYTEETTAVSVLFPTRTLFGSLSHQHRIGSSLRDFLRGVADDIAAVEQQLFDVAQAQLKVEYQRTAQLMTAAGKRWP